MAEIRRFLPVRPIARRCRLSIIGESVVCLGKGFLEAIGRLIPLLSSRDGCNFATDWQKKKATPDSQRICEDFFREKEEGRRSAIKRLLPLYFFPLMPPSRVFSPSREEGPWKVKAKMEGILLAQLFFFAASIFGMDRTRRLGPKGGEGMFEALVWGSWRRRDLLSGGGTDVRYRRGEGE